MATGTVKWFSFQKSYGFITPDNGGGDVFVHSMALQRSGVDNLNEGDRVSYDLEERKGKTSAANIKIIS